MNEIASTPSSLLTQCKKNLPEGWEKMKTLYGRMILYWCRRADLQEEDRYDIYQDVMLSLVKNIQNFRKDRPTDSFRKWLWTITQSRIVDFYRKKNKMPHLAGSLAHIAEEASNEEQLEWEQEENEMLFQQLFELLKEDFQPKTLEAFRLMCQRGATSEEVGDSLGISACAVRAAKKRVMDKIRKIYGELL